MTDREKFEHAKWVLAEVVRRVEGKSARPVPIPYAPSRCEAFLCTHKPPIKLRDRY